MNYYAVLDAGMAWETSQFGDLSRDECVLFYFFSQLVINLFKDSLRRTRSHYTFIAGFVLECRNLHKTFMNYSKHLKSSKLYKNRSESTLSCGVKILSVYTYTTVA